MGWLRRKTCALESTAASNGLRRMVSSGDREPAPGRYGPLRAALAVWSATGCVPRPALLLPPIFDSPGGAVYVPVPAVRVTLSTIRMRGSATARTLHLASVLVLACAAAPGVAVADSCASAADGSRCDDGNACTAPDTCRAGTCQAGPVVSCDDGNPATDDRCFVDRGCEHVPTSSAWTISGKGVAVGTSDGVSRSEQRTVAGMLVLLGDGRYELTGSRCGATGGAIPGEQGTFTQGRDGRLRLQQSNLQAELDAVRACGHLPKLTLRSARHVVRAVETPGRCFRGAPPAAGPHLCGKETVSFSERVRGHVVIVTITLRYTGVPRVQGSASGGS